MQISSLLKTGDFQIAACVRKHMSKRGAGAIGPHECDSEVRSEIASSRIWRDAVRENRGGYLKIRREFYREAVDTRANEQSYLRSAIFLPFSLHYLLQLGNYTTPSAFLSHRPCLLREKNVQLCKNTARKFHRRRSFREGCFWINIEGGGGEKGGRLMRINTTRCWGLFLIFRLLFISHITVRRYLFRVFFFNEPRFVKSWFEYK